MARKTKYKISWSKAKNVRTRMLRNHVKVVEDWFGAEFYNHLAMDTGDSVVSKTSMGRVTSRAKKNRVQHMVGDGEVPIRGLPTAAQ